MAACPCWEDRATVLGPMLMEVTCVRRDTAAERVDVVLTTTNSGVSTFFKHYPALATAVGSYSSCVTLAATGILTPNICV